MEQTLSIIKPDATKRNLIGQILERFENAGLRIVALKRVHLTYEQAAEFYAVHKERPFFDELCTVISSGPIVVQVLEGPQAILKNRELMGATDPAVAIPGTIRADLSLSISENSVHGSDSPETAIEEIAFFFKPQEILPA